MNLARLILRTAAFHWRTNVAVALAVAAAAAVLTGALAVGDSMRASLAHLVLDGLGHIDEVMVGDRFVRFELAGELAAQPGFAAHFQQAEPVAFVRGTLENARPGGALRAGDVSVFGCDASFWRLGSGTPPPQPEKNEILLNEALASAIAAHVGDEVLLRIGSASQIPADSALGRKTETVRSRRLRVSEIVPDHGLGRLSLHPSQQTPRNAFVDRQMLADVIGQADKVNAIFVAGNDRAALSSEAHAELEASFHPRLIDFGIRIEPHNLGYVQCTSDRMLLEPVAVGAALRAFAADRPQAVFTYLANTIAKGEKQIPYSTITGIDFATEPPLGPFKSTDGEPMPALKDEEIALNSWAAEDLGAKVGDAIEITYFEPESTHGRVREKTARFRLAGIVALEGLAADPDLTPQMPGVTDRLSIGDWDAPFPFEPGRVRKQDEEYWDEHRTTPKAFVSLATARRLWSSRFGDTTAVRFAPPPGPTLIAQADQLRLKPEDFGLVFTPIKRLGLAAASGTTPFDALFIGFSLFIEISAVLLVALLFRLGIEQRAAEIGLLSAVGLGNRKLLVLLAAEGALVATIGAAIGVLVGVGYSWLLLVGLSTWWVSAIGTPFLELHVTPQTLVVGYASGIIISLITIGWTLRRLARLPARSLLAGQTQTSYTGSRSAGKRGLLAAAALAVFAVLLAALAPALGGAAQAGAFVGSGALVLAAGLAALWSRLRSGASRSWAGTSSAPVARLAARNSARNPSRSTITIGLMAVASFLIIALSAFRLDPASESLGPDSGSGGFVLLAQSDQPVYQDLNSPAGRSDLGLSAAAEKVLDQTDIIGLRVQSGDDASCLNLYQPTQPRVLGVTPALTKRGGFAWAATAAASEDERKNPWLLLDRKLPADAEGTPVIPAVLDFNTAEYSLHKGKVGERLTIKNEFGQDVRLEIVGLLKNSILQGDMLVSEANFLAQFPRVSGYRMFLIDSHGSDALRVREALEGPLSDFGFTAESTRDRLAALFAVQNTYLSTFQSLGGLGLLLGTFGLATAQLRSVLERRGELALLRATGFRRALVARLVMLESTLVLVAGLGIGVLAALVAVVPHWFLGGASVPWLSLAATLGVVLVVGWLASFVAVRATLKSDLLVALREQ
jgi:ABC-type lipoprotein release transport system permease subunit